MHLFGHRGASGEAPENTLAAFELGIQQGCDGFELDVQLTKDQVAVVIHDWSVNRTTNGQGEVKDLTYNEISGLDAGSWFGESFVGEKIPRLEAVLDAMPPKMWLNVELKSRPQDPPGLVDRVAAILKSHKREEQAILSSFNHELVTEMRRCCPAISRGLLYEGVLLNPLAYAAVHDLGLFSLHPAQEYVSQEMVEAAHRAGLQVVCWTVNEGERGKALAAMGVDIAITNYPERLMPVKHLQKQ